MSAPQTQGTGGQCHECANKHIFNIYPFFFLRKKQLPPSLGPGSHMAVMPDGRCGLVLFTEGYVFKRIGMPHLPFGLRLFAFA